MPRWPDLESLSLLTAVAQRGSLGRAAQDRRISQPSASARINALERRLGVQLLLRSTRGSALTPEGQLVVGWAGSVLAAAEELSRGVAALRRQRSAELTVCASLTIAEYLMPEWLVRLHAEQPDVAVRLQVANSTGVIAAVELGRVPIGFVEGPGVPRTLASARVGLDRLVVVVAPEHSWARRDEPVTMTEFLATPLLLREPESGTRQSLEHAVAAHGTLAPAALELSTTTAIRGAVIGGSAPAVLSELTVRTDLAAGRLVAVAVTGLSVRRRLRAVWRRGASLDGAAKALVELARDQPGTAAAGAASPTTPRR